ncbi:hypothetical protein BOTBODRAFT_50409 [Botryobasidium botryosum FD-172 SS1]|uniref:ATP-dependent RNA helicase n=1 Tax=Botryobasidium botryosum (strain FD-172 SS1) TaxID=930990 RepID=A0A067NCP7_BOTB1|nr:hypothetical protein BOTBODRAFT_50409 [Botryobasidium botryosum FD-172 SS1]
MDDGILLNIVEAGEQSSTRKIPSKKGGRWTDRVKAKKSAKRRARIPEPNASQTIDFELPAEDPASGATVRPTKRARFDVEVVPSVEPTTSTQRPKGQIISSLFSHNPSVPTPERSYSKRPAAAPSNAPLADDTTFLGLGLDPLIVTHLRTKFTIENPTSIQRAALSAILPESTLSRDVFIQSQTGSGKTLAFLLPIIQDLLPLSSLSYIDRSIGTLAIIIAPTRELAKQISDVLESLLTMRLRASENIDDEANGPRLTRWLVSGLLIGGATRAHEKARLRKGVPILVTTPGRLLDHLQNTSSFDVGKCRWLVLDEADRLMELGFEESITGIIKGLDGRRKLAAAAAAEGTSMDVGGWDWERRRRTVLCSATIREDVQKLAGTTLHRPIVVKATDVAQAAAEAQAALNQPRSQIVVDTPLPVDTTKFTPPSQLSQKYVVVPLKLRLVSLIALLRTILTESSKPTTSATPEGSRIIVFLSCTDSVDFHWSLLGGVSMNGGAAPQASLSSDEDSSGSDDENEPREPGAKGEKDDEPIEARCALLPRTSVYRLHGSLDQQTRMASLRGFIGTSKSKDKARTKSPSKEAADKDDDAPTSSILLCTSVASRGLDLPLVRAVVQYDLPTEGGANEYVHRVGRTARAGKGGEAWAIITPSETDWVGWVEGKMNKDAKDSARKAGVKLHAVGVQDVLRQGFGGRGTDYEVRATEVQLAFERWVLKGNNALARQAFQSHMRAYATHPSDEKHIFHIRHLHTGHLAKAFALREAPTAVSGQVTKKSAKEKKVGKFNGGGKKSSQRADREDKIGAGGKADTGDRMRDAIRVQGRLAKQGGAMVRSGVDDFQIASGYDLERLVHGQK